MLISTKASATLSDRISRESEIFCQGLFLSARWFIASQVARKGLQLIILPDRESAEYLKGIEMIVKQFEGLADQLEHEVIGEPGDPFDPNLHEAVMHVEDESFNENVIAEVLQKGYKLGDTVIRAAMVKVAN